MDLIYAQNLIYKHRLLLQLQCQSLTDNIERSTTQEVNNAVIFPGCLEPTLRRLIIPPLAPHLTRDTNAITHLLANHLRTVNSTDNVVHGDLKELTYVDNTIKLNSFELHASKKRKLLKDCKSSAIKYDIEPDLSLSHVKSNLDKKSCTSPTIPPSSVGLELYNENDVLCGRGGGTNVHSGNRYFRTLININRRTYLCARKNDKPGISRSIVRNVRKRKGRFLKKDAVSGLWFDIGDNAAREKASQALRQRASDYRKVILTQNNTLDPFSLQKPLVPCMDEAMTPERIQSLQEDNMGKISSRTRELY